MTFDPKQNQDLDWLKEPMPDSLRNKIFNAAQFELDVNKANSTLNSSNYFKWVWSCAIGFALAAMVAIRLTGMIGSDSPSTTFQDLALLTPAEIEVVENLDILENIDTINLDQIRKEMKMRGKKS